MQRVEIVSVNVGQPQDIRLGKHHSLSGIDKRPVSGRVEVGGLGLEGDHILSRKHHGGPDQAVYLYSLDDYAAFAEVVGGLPAPGRFGENLTVSGLESAAVRIGARLSIGGVLLEVTAPRIPCATFAAHMGDAGFVKVFRNMRRPGLYARVLKPGEVGVGDTVTVQGRTERRSDGTRTVRAVLRPQPQPGGAGASAGRAHRDPCAPGLSGAAGQAVTRHLLRSIKISPPQFAQML